jgi:integration host factor subunit beta
VAVDQKCVPFFKTGKEMRERLNRDDGAVGEAADQPAAQSSS